MMKCINKQDTCLQNSSNLLMMILWMDLDFMMKLINKEKYLFNLEMNAMK
jgi:hypothetical protein